MRTAVIALAVLGCKGPDARPPDHNPADATVAPPDDAPVTPVDGEDVPPDAGAPVTPDVHTVPPQTCGTPIDVNALYAERFGWGATATGGDPTRIYTVDTLSGGVAGSGNHGSLRRALESAEPYWIVFAVDGEIELEPEDVDMLGNKTIDGRGRSVTINGALKIEDVQNVIVTDVTLTNDRHLAECGQAGDVVVIRGPGGPDPSDFTARRFWFHHVDFKRGGDGLLDLRGATDVTISWSKFHEHSKGMLMWKETNGLPAGGMRVTMHHNLVDKLTVRGPRFHYGKLHYANNFVHHWYDYGVGCMDAAQCLFQGNVFEARPACTPIQILLGQCQDPAPCGDSDGGTPTTAVVTDDGDARGFTRSDGDLKLGGAALDIHQPNMVFTNPGYPFAVETATQAMADRIRMHAGPRTLLCHAP
jgi:pectate lyase